MRSITSELVAATFALVLTAAATPARAQADRAERQDEGGAALAPESDDRRLPVGAEDLPPPSAGELLAERERALDAREAELEQLAKDIDSAKEQLESEIARLERLLEARKRVEQDIRTEAEQEELRRLARMTEITSKMPPESAAAYLSELSVSTATQILDGIKSRKAAAIMAALPPSKAAEIGRKYLKSGKSSSQPSLTSGGEAGRGGTVAGGAPSAR